MKKIFLAGVFVLGLGIHPSHAFFGDGGGGYAAAAAIAKQTAVQTAEHISRLQEMIQKVKYMKEQVFQTEEILELAKYAKDGVDDLMNIQNDFRNIIAETEGMVQSMEGMFDDLQSIPDEWRNMFGSMDNLRDDYEQFLGSIDVSDEVNSRGYLISQSYQNNYESTAQTAQQLMNNAEFVNEKGALKQIAQEMAILIQMENHVVNLLSHMLEAQSVQNAAQNVKQKDAINQFEAESNRMSKFLNMVDENTLRMD